MKIFSKIKVKTINIIILPIFILFLAFSINENQPTEQIKIRLTKNNSEVTNLLNNLRSKFAELKSIENKGLSPKDKIKRINQIKSNFAGLRLTYKKYEYLYEYIDPEMIKRNINSAPLSWTNYKDATPKVYEPLGLQVLEELIYEDSLDINKILELLNQLESSFNNLFLLINTTKLQDRFIFEAVRFELIRILSFSVTGFDSPTSLHSLNETEICLKTILEDVKLYNDYNSKYKSENYYKLLELLNNSITFVSKNKNFEKFDRLTFTRSYIEPLFNYSLKTQLDFNIETHKEVNKVPTVFNYTSSSIFSDDFLNPFYYTNSLNKTNESMIKLGELLFYDENLSINKKQSCGGCHLPQKAFTDGLKTNMSSNGNSKLLRNTPTLLNSIYADKFFYDMRASSPEMQIEHVLLNENEFNNDLVKMMNSLAKDKKYKELFDKSFKDYDKSYNKNYETNVSETVNIQNLKRAITSYVIQLRSFNSKFDKYIRNESNNFSKSEKNGFNLFMGKALCGNCHFPPTFSGLVPPLYNENESEVLGVPENKSLKSPKLDSDLGRFNGIQRDNLSIYKHSFKTPTIRNIEFTAPYMHNGVYDNLNEVMDFYNKGGGKGLGINLENQTLPFDNLNLKKSEINDLINFMKTLSDTTTQFAKKSM